MFSEFKECGGTRCLYKSINKVLIVIRFKMY